MIHRDRCFTVCPPSRGGALTATRTAGLTAALTALALVPLASAAQGPTPVDGPLRQVGACVGGAWVAEEPQQDAAGRSFLPVKVCEWALGGAALRVTQASLYEDGTLEPALEGLNAWDPAAGTVRAFGVFVHGGIVREATYAPESLDRGPRILRFTFVAPGTGAETTWRSVERVVDEHTHIEEGEMWVDGVWTPMSRLTYRRLDRVDGAATYRRMLRSRPP